MDDYKQADERSDTAIDPVCGMTVSPNTAAGSFEYNGLTYYFCSTHCFAKFQRDPDAFLNEPAVSMMAQPVRIKRAKPASKANAENGSGYTCMMHPDVRESKPGSCPKCGMALEPATISAPQKKIEYTCPMHPEIVRDAPGSCPICGMALEPRTVSLDEEENSELMQMTRRFWVCVALTIPLLIIGMSELIPGAPFDSALPMKSRAWIELALATPVVLWGAWPFFVRAWQSLVNRSLNMFTLIGVGVGVAYLFSVIAKLSPEIFPSSFRDPMGNVPV